MTGGLRLMFALDAVSRAHGAVVAGQTELARLILAGLHDDLVDEFELAQPDVDLLGRAVLLAPTIETCEALLRGEQVPLDRLDPVQVRRFGRRDR